MFYIRTVNIVDFFNSEASYILPLTEMVITFDKPRPMPFSARHMYWPSWWCAAGAMLSEPLASTENCRSRFDTGLKSPDPDPGKDQFLFLQKIFHHGYVIKILIILKSYILDE